MIGLGCMRLSTDAGRDEAGARAVIAAALDAGVDRLDTADAYGLDAGDVGHNERLIAAAVAAMAETPTHAGARGRVTIVTKGGLTRPGGAWVPDGRARHLAAAARASRARLDVDAIDLYLLHAVDPRTPLATSVRALARLQDDGVVRAIGLSNVGVAQLEEALAIAPIAAVEIELSPWKLDALRGGLVEACARRGIEVLAYRPLGGAAGVKRLARDPVVAAIAARHGASAAEVALAWMRSLSPVIVPLPGATRIETARSAARAAALVLDDDARGALHARFVAVAAPAASIRVPRGAAEVVVIAGMPAAGKSTLAADHVARGYTRLNRDERGGTLLELARALDRALADGATAIVLDNTYATRAARAPVIEVARRHGATTRLLSLVVSIEEAQAHAVARMLDRHGRLLEPAEIAADPRELGPGAQFRFRREHEPPGADEGWDAIEEVRPAPRAPAGGAPALIVELDDLVWRGRPSTPDAIALRDDQVAAHLAAWAAAGAVVAGTTWQPDGLDAARLDALRARLRALTGVAIEVACCPHPAGPPVCWCRKPLPGLGLVLARAHAIDLARTVHVGRGPADRGFALRVGVRYVDVAEGWPAPSFDASPCSG